MCVSSPTPASGQARLGWSSLDSYSCRPHLLAFPLFLCRCGLGGGVCFPGDGLGTGSWARTSFITLLAFALLGRRRERWGSTCVPWSPGLGLAEHSAGRSCHHCTCHCCPGGHVCGCPHAGTRSACFPSFTQLTIFCKTQEERPPGSLC